MKQVLVTGAAGFLGSHLAMHHLSQGDNVVGIDDFTSSSDKSEHLARLKEFKGFNFIEGDITDDVLKGFDPHGRAGRIELIYNFACPASPPVYQDMPIHTMMTCVVGTGNVLELAERHGAVVVHASTSEVYGDPKVSPQSETYRGEVNSYGPRACYDEGKRAAEALCYDFRQRYGVDARLVRIFNTYGPHMDPYDGRVVTNFIQQALKKQPITVYGDGNQTRSFCYVDDLIRGIVAMGELKENPGGPINLGNPTEFTILELAQAVLKLVNRDRIDGYSVMHRCPLPADDPMQRRPNIFRARELLGWEPKVQLEIGLDRTIAYVKSVLR